MIILSFVLDPEAIQLIAKNLRKAVDNDPEGREGMALAQYVTAMAYSNAGLGIAHSMAHTLGAVYDTPHGVACASPLPQTHARPEIPERQASRTSKKCSEN